MKSGKMGNMPKSMPKEHKGMTPKEHQEAMKKLKKGC